MKFGACGGAAQGGSAPSAPRPAPRVAGCLRRAGRLVSLVFVAGPSRQATGSQRRRPPAQQPSECESSFHRPAAPASLVAGCLRPAGPLSSCFLPARPSRPGPSFAGVAAARRAAQPAGVERPPPPAPPPTLCAPRRQTAAPGRAAGLPVFRCRPLEGGVRRAGSLLGACNEAAAACCGGGARRAPRARSAPAPAVYN